MGLTLRNINKIFEKGTINENYVLRDFSLNIDEGDFVSIIGGNGAGKTTLMNIIAGVLTTDDGNILLDDVDITKDDVAKRSKSIARVFQDPKMGTATRMTIEQNMAVALKRGKRRNIGFAVKKEDRKIYKKILEELDLGLEKKLKVGVGYLSGGQRQALTLVMATLVKPKILLLDEHTAALDPKTSGMVMDLTKKIVEKDNLTTIMITHNMEHAIKYGNRLVMLHQGRIVVDIKGEEKENLSVEKLMELFKKNSGTNAVSDELILV
ncbi:ABC transporter ATP-binding protein [Gemella cuniculi]|uniref:ABC transporter ATP-binding protein n=1 Tax=Gemella cuniculi TaxID=150240 RepID=UPI00041C6D4E|nr:ATP-binding cassette domain-containing protein [Gemella cuniculi]